ncbi:hypothetical protein RFI_35794 [Reticulomyxa filosa]|uniref:Uncharacterized protein n=1 Tax=Reticulomyxa filosa TaxID=46433 RepID=X6LJT9_RETFI|nr:hypothetical protein RFI_35794 [Reticulomyxa filosa]|eukprot:ETO01646.1 hypothetical protein RFI_35794 [Reticulomyxa filosa]
MTNTDKEIIRFGTTSREYQKIENAHCRSLRRKPPKRGMDYKDRGDWDGLPYQQQFFILKNIFVLREKYQMPFFLIKKSVRNVDIIYVMWENIKIEPKLDSCLCNAMVTLHNKKTKTSEIIQTK